MCQYGTFECVIMPYRLKNTPLHLQWFMNLLLADLLNMCVLVYMDNILIYSKTTEEHFAHVKAVFECLAAKNWHVEEKKCVLFLPEVGFLGNVVSAAGVKVAVDKVDTVASWPTPTCVCEVQGFLGLANFYRRCVKNFATIAKPLTNLTKKAFKFKWEATKEAAFEVLKKALITAPILQVFDEEKPHEVWVDASDYAVGATLVQPSNDRKTWL